MTPSMTRPPEARRSAAATAVVTRTSSSYSPAGSTGSAQERGRHPRVDRDVQPGGQGQFTGGEHEPGRRHMLGPDLAPQQGPFGVEGAELGLGDAVDRRPLRAPAAGEDAGAADDAVRGDAVDPAG